MFPLRDVNPRRSFPIIVVLIIIFNTWVFFQYSGLPEKRIERLFQVLGIVPAHLNLFSLITHQFLHGGLLHLISNMWALWIFGDNIEDRMGHSRFFIFYILCGVCAGIIHTITQLGSEVPCVGASGAISGVLGAYMLLYPGARLLCLIPIIFYPYFVEMPAFLFGGIWFILQLLNGFIVMASKEDVAGVAWWAHIGGFFAGIFLSGFFIEKDIPPEETTHEDEMDL